ncbi:MAG: zinc ribbon domain-containing protein [Dehalococcoidia bacterium]|nr:zinc ribbon domain-containing protein [Dehalococcoidia bacterium]
MDEVYQAIALIAAAVAVLGALTTVLRLHGERPFSALGVIVAALGALAAVVLYSLTFDVELKQEAISGLVAGGAVAGLVLGFKLPLYVGGGSVVSRMAGWHLALPGLAVAALQIEGVRGSMDGVVFSLAALYAATALAVAACAALLLRRVGLRQARVIAAEETQAQEVALCAACGARLSTGARFCRRCGSAVP